MSGPIYFCRVLIFCLIQILRQFFDVCCADCVVVPFLFFSCSLPNLAADLFVGFRHFAVALCSFAQPPPPPPSRFCTSAHPLPPSSSYIICECPQSARLSTSSHST